MVRAIVFILVTFPVFWCRSAPLESMFRETSAGAVYDFSNVLRNLNERWTTNYWIEGQVWWQDSSGILVKGQSGFDFYWILQAPRLRFGDSFRSTVLPSKSLRVELPSREKQIISELTAAAGHQVDSGTKVILLSGQQGLLRHSFARRMLENGEVSGGSFLAMSPEMRDAILFEKQQIEWERHLHLLTMAKSNALFLTFIYTTPTTNLIGLSNVWRVTPTGFVKQAIAKNSPVKSPVSPN